MRFKLSHESLNMYNKISCYIISSRFYRSIRSAWRKFVQFMISSNCIFLNEKLSLLTETSKETEKISPLWIRIDEQTMKRKNFMVNLTWKKILKNIILFLSAYFRLCHLHCFADFRVCSLVSGWRKLGEFLCNRNQKLLILTAIEILLEIYFQNSRRLAPDEHFVPLTSESSWSLRTFFCCSAIHTICYENWVHKLFFFHWFDFECEQFYSILQMSFKLCSEIEGVEYVCTANEYLMFMIPYHPLITWVSISNIQKLLHLSFLHTQHIP